MVRTEDFDCGIMISASCNRYYGNGLKVMNRNGEKMSNTVLEGIEKYIDGEFGEIPFATGADIGRTIDYQYDRDRNRYIGYIISLVRNSYRGINNCDSTHMEGLCTSDLMAMLTDASLLMKTETR